VCGISCKFFKFTFRFYRRSSIWYLRH
jgi:hypothetical protein